MTGFGASSSSSSLGEISVEVKSLNNRFLDVSVRSPRELFSTELKIRDLVKRMLRRGKVDVYVRFTPAAGAEALFEIDRNLLRHYADSLTAALKDSESFSGVKPDPTALLQLPGVVNPTPAARDDGPLSELVLHTLGKALEALDQSRRAEGAELGAVMSNHLDNLLKHRADVESVKDELLQEYRTRLKERIEVLGKTLEATLDPVRVETEIMFYADKSDITEELVRLDAHLKAFAKMLESDSGEPVGKPMDFLVQELLRETNTIGNKARGVAVASRIVQMKSEIEKVREQVQNLE